ncbi:MAG: diaminopimelate aminotransferase [Candidatus Micrarchaeota archaeon]|nr:MAG: diaminopimelate aminotransferase [Candidatus Micrarchaeota archaeon]
MAKDIIEYKSEIVRDLSSIIEVPAISPLSNGEGEAKRAELIMSILDKYKLGYDVYRYKDDMGFDRVNIVAYDRDRLDSKKRDLYLIGHIDTVAPGDIKSWERDPFKAFYDSKEDKLYGRGSLDDGHGVMASLYTLRYLKESSLEAKYNVKALFAADEELGSKYGIQKLIQDNIFKRDSLFVVPDWWTERGDIIEIAEKGILWLKVSVIGQQVHASTPDKGLNATLLMSKLINSLYIRLHERFNKRSKLFDPEISTFEPTKIEQNTDSINIIPGKNVFYIDCRYLPDYKREDIIEEIKKVANEIGVKIELEIVNDSNASYVNQNSELVRSLTEAIKKTRSIEPKLVGIGGGTCAGFLRNAGFDAVVYGTGEDVAHQPNEYIVIKNLIEDIKTFIELVRS